MRIQGNEMTVAPGLSPAVGGCRLTTQSSQPVSNPAVWHLRSQGA